MLMRLYNPTSGKLIFDNMECQSMSLTALRKQMALVPQDIFLFGGTIRENIAYGKPKATDRRNYRSRKKSQRLGVYQYHE
jgi:ABC-type multidrug transport system fused ATPase/permease subunit